MRSHPEKDYGTSLKSDCLESILRLRKENPLKVIPDADLGHKVRQYNV